MRGARRRLYFLRTTPWPMAKEAASIQGNSSRVQPDLFPGSLMTSLIPAPG
jgi:hypothetical protein